MPAPIFKRTYRNDEEVEYTVNGEHIILANYDDHGGEGMRDISAMFERIAAAIGVEVQHE